MANTLVVPDNFVPIELGSDLFNIPDVGPALYTVTTYLEGKSQKRADEKNKFRLEQSLLSDKLHMISQLKSIIYTVD